MKKNNYFVLFVFLFFSLFLSCSSDDETVFDEDTEIADNVLQDNDFIQNEFTVETENNVNDEDVIGVKFCSSGDVLIPDNGQMFVNCEKELSKKQKMICKNGSWQNVGDCVDSMVEIPAGKFNMGCRKSIEGNNYLCDKDDVPEHTVELSAFKIDKFEVTVEDYNKCIASGDCLNVGTKKMFQTYSDNEKCNLGAPGRKHNPMNCVSWEGANMFCKWAGKKLPTEAQWEKAAKGTKFRLYPWGDKPKPSCQIAIVKNITDGCDFDSTFPVGTKENGKSAFGVYDMGGNVSEYVSDWYKKDFYASSEATKKDVLGPENSGEEKLKISRGGSFFDKDKELRTFFRVSCGMNDMTVNLGFRCVK